MSPDEPTVIRSLGDRDDTRHLTLGDLDLQEAGPRHAATPNRSGQAKVAAGFTGILVVALLTGYGTYRYGTRAEREPVHDSVAPAPSASSAVTPPRPTRPRSRRPYRSRPRVVPVPPTSRKPPSPSPTPTKTSASRPPKPTPCPSPTSPRPSRTPASPTPSPTHTWTFPDGAHRGH